LEHSAILNRISNGNSSGATNLILYMEEKEEKEKKEGEESN